MRARNWFCEALCLVAATMFIGSGCTKAPPAAKLKAHEQVGRPEAKSAEKPSETAKPAEKESGKPAEKPAEKPGGQSAAKPAEKPAEKTPEKPADPAVVKPAEKPVETAATKPAEKPAERMAAKTAVLEIPVPLGLPKLPVPADNPMTAEKIELGKMLYFDKRVSKDGTVACATCHDPKMAWAEQTATSTGIHKQVGARNSPTVINSAYATSMFWDGREATLEGQATGPVENSIEMGHKMADLVVELDKIPGYHERFQKVFGTPVTKEGFGKAIAAFERTVLSGDSPYDRFKAGDEKALNDAQKRGLKLFEKSGCADCHADELFSTYEFHNAGVGADKPKPDEGRKAVTKKDEDTGAFRVPSLRNVADTAPYFHDGSAKTLEEAVALMAAGGRDNKHRSEDFDTVRKAKLTPEQQKDLVEFLKALSGKYPVIEPPVLP